MVFLALGSLILGIGCGAAFPRSAFLTALTDHSQQLLWLLMFSVGISVGMQKGILTRLRQYHVKILVIPFGIIAGSLIGGVLCRLILNYPLNEAVSIAGGMGWYSLAGVSISGLAGAESGSIAFLSNLMREIGSFFMIPYLSRHFNSFTCIAPAAATSEDTTLPMLMRYTNEETVVFAVLNGMICSAFVPVVISLCY
ncbi:MAG TPA: lysine exporter LysO family protein [Firmicutes bacterium]|nr:lysine exporter LysO family protein [Bacillota bacterium]